MREPIKFLFNFRIIRLNNFFQFFELQLERLLTAVAHPVVKMDRPARLFSQAPAQHARHGCDADTAANQHRRHVGRSIDVKVTRRRLDLEHLTGLNLIMQMVGGQPGRQLGPIWRRDDSLDGNAVARRVGALGE